LLRSLCFGDHRATNYACVNDPLIPCIFGELSSGIFQYSIITIHPFDGRPIYLLILFCCNLCFISSYIFCYGPLRFCDNRAANYTCVNDPLISCILGELSSGIFWYSIIAIHPFDGRPIYLLILFCCNLCFCQKTHFCCTKSLS
jgi:hypothetical protein